VDLSIACGIWRNATKEGGFPEGEIYSERRTQPDASLCRDEMDPANRTRFNQRGQLLKPFWSSDGTPWLTDADQGFAIDQTPSAIGSLVAIISRPCEI
jgi:hypothetical protein